MLKRQIKTKGSFLIELLIVIAILAIILGVGAQAVLVSLRSGKVSGERDGAVGLMNEELEAVRAMVEENWQNISLLSDNVHYTMKLAGTRWATSTPSGVDEVVSLNGVSYARYFITQNVCRDTISGSRNITGITDTSGTTTTCAGSTGEYDPNTQKVTVAVNWQGGNPVSISSYFSRWRNRACGQADWSGGMTSPADPLTVCGSNTYFADDGNITSTTPSSLELK